MPSLPSLPFFHDFPLNVGRRMHGQLSIISGEHMAHAAHTRTYKRFPLRIS